MAYFLGSIPTGYLVARARGIDIRSVGSGNIGATNVLRILGKPAGIGVLLADALKPSAVKAHPAFTPDSDPAPAAAAIADARARCLVVVSHMPLLPLLLAALTGARAEFGTGTVAHLRMVGPRQGALLGLWSAEHLARVQIDGAAP